MICNTAVRTTLRQHACILSPMQNSSMERLKRLQHMQAAGTERIPSTDLPSCCLPRLQNSSTERLKQFVLMEPLIVKPRIPVSKNAVTRGCCCPPGHAIADGRAACGWL